MILKMLNDIRIYTTDAIWRQILTSLGAVIVDDQSVAELNLDQMDVATNISPIELKSLVLNTVETNQQNIIKKIFKKSIMLPQLQMQIVVLLYQTGGLSGEKLRSILAPDITTHTIDTAIYQLRKTYGRDFIKNENGKYIIGQ